LYWSITLGSARGGYSRAVVGSSETIACGGAVPTTSARPGDVLDAVVEALGAVFDLVSARGGVVWLEHDSTPDAIKIDPACPIHHRRVRAPE
jgi:hypothetical protein